MYENEKVVGIIIAIVLVTGVVSAAGIFFASRDTQATGTERGRIENGATTIMAKDPEAQRMANATQQGNFVPRNVDHIGSHIYVTDNVFRDRNLTEDVKKEIRP